jgi:O-methyltransferase
MFAIGYSQVEMEENCKGFGASTRKKFRRIIGLVFTRPFQLVFLKLPYVVYFLCLKDIGREYSIGFREKFRLVLKIWKNKKRLPTLSHWLEHLELVSTILQIPRSLEGAVIECGCYKGGSSVNLSLVCSLVDRRLVICDSFEGLPEPKEYDRAHYAVHTGHTDTYEKGRFSASLAEVQENIARYGSLDVCDFVVGYFQDTLPDLQGKYVMAFLDVDFIDSLKPCIKAIWPNLQEGCKVYVHEARSLPLVSVFFDSSWWSENLKEAPPGFVGAGTGLPLQVLEGSELGYSKKGIQSSLPQQSS